MARVPSYSPMWKRLPAGLWILLAVTLVLLPSLAVLQFRWLARVTEGERERANGLLHAAATQFCQAFDAEISRAYSIFQRQKTDDLGALSQEYARRFEKWEQSAPHPPLVREVFVVVEDEHKATRLLRFDQAEHGLEPVDWPPDMAALRAQVTRPASDPISEEPPALIVAPEDAFKVGMELQPGPAPRLVCAIVMLDLEYIGKQLLPALAQRYFPPGNGLSYDITVVTGGGARSAIYRSSPGESGDHPNHGLEMGLFDIRLETLLGRDAAGSADEPGRIIHVVKRQPGDDEPGDGMRGRWRLLAGYRPGSLEAMIARDRRGNLVIGSGILLLLAASIGAVVVSTARAARLARDQIRFVAGVTHELRTPLAVICAAGENLADGVVRDAGQVREYGRVIRDGGRRLAGMVEQVLEYAGAQSPGPFYTMRDCDVGEIIEAAVAELRMDAETNGFTLEVEVEPCLPGIAADAVALKRALQNLVGNSIKYDAGRRWVGVYARKSAVADPGREIRLIVSDRGRGILPSDLPHVFEPFYRGRDVAAAQIHGSGLGLSLVRNTIRAHAGRITVESEVGRGSSFSIYLPIRAPSGPAEHASNR